MTELLPETVVLRLSVRAEQDAPQQRYCDVLVSKAEWAALAPPRHHADRPITAEAMENRSRALAGVQQKLAVALRAVSRYAPALRGPEPEPIVGS